MSIVVQKFGGTSVADTDQIKAAARKAIRAQKDGNQVVMVVVAEVAAGHRAEEARSCPTSPQR